MRAGTTVGQEATETIVVRNLSQASAEQVSEKRVRGWEVFDVEYSTQAYEMIVRRDGVGSRPGIPSMAT